MALCLLILLFLLPALGNVARAQATTSEDEKCSKDGRPKSKTESGSSDTGSTSKLRIIHLGSFHGQEEETFILLRPPKRMCARVCVFLD